MYIAGKSKSTILTIFDGIYQERCGFSMAMLLLPEGMSQLHWLRKMRNNLVGRQGCGPLNIPNIEKHLLKNGLPFLNLLTLWQKRWDSESEKKEYVRNEYVSQEKPTAERLISQPVINLSDPEGVRNLQLGSSVSVQILFRFKAILGLGPGPLGVTGGVYLNVLDINIDIIVGTKGVTYTH